MVVEQDALPLVVTPTVDVEGMHGDLPYEKMALGRLGAKEDWGALRLGRIFRRWGISATFFLDVYEYTFWGEEVIRGLGEGLLDLQQDVQLHTHPAWRDDLADRYHPHLRRMKVDHGFLSQKEDMMAKLPLDRQVVVLEKGIECFRKWFGFRPSSHRSGGYSINADTVSALRDCQIRIDSSMYAGHPNTRLSWSNNQIVSHDGIWELPVSVADYLFQPIPGIRSVYRKRLKMDLDTSTLDEMMAFVAQGRMSGVAYMNVFMHSYSLLEFDRHFRHFCPSVRKEQMLVQFLGRCSEMPGVEFRSCEGWRPVLDRELSNSVGTDEVPGIEATSHVARLGLMKVRNRLEDCIERILMGGAP